MSKFMEWQAHLTMSQACAISVSIFIVVLVVVTLIDDIRSKRRADRNRTIRLD